MFDGHGGRSDLSVVKPLLGELAEEAQQGLAAVAAPPRDVPELEGKREAAGGLVRAVAEPGGRIRSLVVEGRALRSSSQDVAAHITAATTAALDELHSLTRREAGLVAVDQVRLSELRETTMRQSADFMRSISDVINSIQPR